MCSAPVNQFQFGNSPAGLLSAEGFGHTGYYGEISNHIFKNNHYWLIKDSGQTQIHNLNRRCGVEVKTPQGSPCNSLNNHINPTHLAQTVCINRCTYGGMCMCVPTTTYRISINREFGNNDESLAFPTTLKNSVI